MCGRGGGRLGAVSNLLRLLAPLLTMQWQAHQHASGDDRATTQV